MTQQPKIKVVKREAATSEETKRQIRRHVNSLRKAAKESPAEFKEIASEIRELVV